MTEPLEFELKVIKKGNNIVYEILRKGLVVGLLSLEKPYNEEKCIKNVLQMFKEVK